MDKQLLPLMPAPSSSVAAPGAAGPRQGSGADNRVAFTRQKRRQVASACANCRRRKEKCDDKRPTCGACARRGVVCNNVTKGDEVSLTSTLRTRNAALKQENDQLRQLFSILRRASATGGQELLTRLRVAEDPIQILSSIQESTLISSCPDSPLGAQQMDPKLERIDLLALRESLLRVEARPWTVVAPDGLVSELISSFFIWDDPFFLPLIDREAFLTGMRSGRPATAKYCSPFLVNAICASRCFTCRRTRAFGSLSGRDMAAEFLNEAKKMLAMENGRASICTVQGLTLLFSVSAYSGMDRAGMLYRSAAYEMYYRLHVDGLYDEIREDPTKALERNVLSRLAWGLFCFESIVGYVYLQISLVPPPNIPRCFEKPSVSESNLKPVDLFGNPHNQASRSPPFVPGALYLACDLMLMLYSSMEWNIRSESIYGTEEDLKVRRQKLQEVRRWRDALPLNMRDDINFTPQTCYLSAYSNEVLISILRPLDPLTEIEPGWTAKDLCLTYCRIDIDNMEQFVQTYTLRDYACINICGAYNSILTLVFHMRDAAVHEMFAKASYLILQTGADFPMSRFILQGVRAMSWSLKVPIPAVARQYYETLGSAKEALRDLPISFALPELNNMRQLLTEPAKKPRSKATDNMGTLLSRWSAMSIE